MTHNNAKIYDNIILFEDENHTIIGCPVCGEPLETDDICGKCGWQNTGLYNIDYGPNNMTFNMTLRDAKRAYADGLPLN
ncbi:MAG: hypothetical protein Q4D97_02230 [Eubacteriales bacterium]|nr:hypothetical protein [Eubacteriales bacterium]